MIELLKKLGLPNIVVAVIAALVTVTPFLFSIDERYAKSAEVEKELVELRRQNSELARELAQNTGFQQAIVALMTKQNIQAPIHSQPPAVSASPGVSLSPAPESAPQKPEVVPLETPRSWNELKDGLSRQQDRLLKNYSIKSN